MLILLRNPMYVGWGVTEWEYKLVDALWAFRTAYKSPIRSTPFRIVYGKVCHIPIEMEHKAYWALKNVNLDLDVVGRNSNYGVIVEVMLKGTHFGA
ncbi:reverse transcriptase domain-containing protein [Tanacetum coccineum]